MTAIWEQILASDWRSTPCVTGRAASEADVLAGRAVFYIEGDSAAAPVQIPCCAIQTLDDGSEQPVVIVQAELGPDGILFGVRPLSGGNGICLSNEVHLLPAGFES